MQQAGQWARLIQWRRYVLYPTPVLLWSLFFGSRLAVVVLPLSSLFVGVLFLLLYFLVGFLLFPTPQPLDAKSPYTYIDVYEALRQQRSWVFGLALLAELLLLSADWSAGNTVADGRFLVLGVLFGGFWTEHKGLMLVWVWLGLGSVFGGCF